MNDKIDRQFGAIAACDVKGTLADMLRGGVLFEVETPEEAKIAEKAGAIAVIAKIRDDHPERQLQPLLQVQAIQQAVAIPVISYCRPGHVVEAELLEALFIDFIDESLAEQDEEHLYIDKTAFEVPFISPAPDLANGLVRVVEGASLLRSGTTYTSLTGASNLLRAIKNDLKFLSLLNREEVALWCAKKGIPFDAALICRETNQLPVPHLVSARVVDLSDVALLRRLGADSVIVSNDFMNHSHPLQFAKSLVFGAIHFNEVEFLVKEITGQGDDYKIRHHLESKKEELVW